MATRLENALILALPDDAENTLGVTRGASQVAAERDRTATYKTPEGRAALFQGAYPRAWGKKKITPDAFLIGRLRFEPTMNKEEVGLQVFDRKDPKTLRPVPLKGETLLAVTRQILVDANQPFAVREEYFKTRGGPDLPDPTALSADLAVLPIIKPVLPKGKPPETGKEPEQRPATGPKPANPPADVWAAVDALLDFQVHYDGQPVPRQPDGDYPPPKNGQKVYFTMRVKKDEKLGVVLLVNGINTADHDRSSKEVNAHTKWVLAPGKEYWVRGYYDGKEMVHEFQAADTTTGVEELSALAPADRFGLIELHVYREVPAGRDQPALAQPGRLLREDTGETESLADAKLALMQAINRAAAPKTRSLIIPGKTEKVAVEAAEIRGELAAKVVVRYSPVASRR
jgi:hypothetical protein